MEPDYEAWGQEFESLGARQFLTSTANQIHRRRPRRLSLIIPRPELWPPARASIVPERPPLGSEFGFEIGSHQSRRVHRLAVSIASARFDRVWSSVATRSFNSTRWRAARAEDEKRYRHDAANIDAGNDAF
jgi:hypothetical protein